MRIRLTLLTLLVLAAMPEAATLDPARAFLNTAFHLSAPELKRLDAGGVISRTLDATDRREVAAPRHCSH